MKLLLENWRRFVTEAEQSVGSIKEFFHSPEIRALAPPSTRPGSSKSPWMLGGCLIAAEAIQRIFGGSLVGLDADAGEAPGDDLVHVVVKHKGGYLDAYGFHGGIEDIQKILDDELSFGSPVYPLPVSVGQATDAGFRQDKRLSGEIASLFEEK
jgi:hypothetical protein